MDIGALKARLLQGGVIERDKSNTGLLIAILLVLLYASFNLTLKATPEAFESHRFPYVLLFMLSPSMVYLLVAIRTITHHKAVLRGCFKLVLACALTANAFVGSPRTVTSLQLISTFPERYAAAKLAKKNSVKTPPSQPTPSPAPVVPAPSWIDYYAAELELGR